jgi:hypothetical protein
MKTVKIHSRKQKISEPELRGLRALKASGFVALTSDLYERRSGGHGTCLLPGGDTEPLTVAQRQYLGRGCRWELLGVERWERDKGHNAGAWIGCPKRITSFFGDHPRARYAIGGDPRRINAILRQADR